MKLELSGTETIKNRWISSKSMMPRAAEEVGDKPGGGVKEPHIVNFCNAPNCQ